MGNKRLCFYLTSFLGRDFDVVKLKDIFSKEKTEELTNARRILAIAATSVTVVVVGIVGVVFSSEVVHPTAEIVSTESVIESTEEQADEATTTATTTTTTTSSTKKKSTTTTTDLEFVITGETSSDPYVSSIATAQSYETGDISEDEFTVRDIDSGELVTSDGYDILCQVVNGEMGSSFSSEALKAQAVAAYTYILYCESIDEIPELGLNANYTSKIENAVSAVEGLVCTYNGKIINAVFSACSTGITASSKNAWGGSLSYLISVNSKYDTQATDYEVDTTLSHTIVQMTLALRLGIDLSDNPEEWFEITGTYDGSYVSEVTLCDGTTVTGDFIKELFGLRSNAFIISYKDSAFTFTTYGYGHGVGMSQEGANFYASKDGLKFDQILKHYYTGIKVELSDNAQKTVVEVETTEATTTTTKKTTTKKTTTKKTTTKKKTTTTKKITTKKKTTTAATTKTTTTTAATAAGQTTTTVPDETTYSEDEQTEELTTAEQAEEETTTTAYYEEETTTISEEAETEAEQQEQDEDTPEE